MSKILYFDCFSGISGDMVLGALLDAGLPMAELRRALGSLTLDGYAVSAEKVLRAGLAATKFHVGEPRQSSTSPGRRMIMRTTLPDTMQPTHTTRRLTATTACPRFRRLVDRSALSNEGKQRVKQMFNRLAEAEAAIHRMPVDQVHLHEVGALDSIVDIVGAVFGLEWLGANRIVSSPLNVGGGMVRSAHGVFPVPAPATLSLLQGVPVYSSGVQAELVTPTGALIVTEFASAFGVMPAMTVTAVGYGAGERNPADTPNVLRLMVGEAATTSPVERVLSLACEIDDMNPQIFGLLMDRLYAAGALEVFFSAVQMKKNRPGTLVTVIGPLARRGR